MELINKDTPQVKEFISSLDSMLNGIESIVKHYKPHLNGERFLFNLKSATIIQYTIKGRFMSR